MECFSTYFYGKISFLDKYYWVIAVRNLKYFAIGYYFNKKRKIFEKYNSTIMCAICMILSIVNSFYPFMDTICSALITSLGFYYLAVQISHSRLLIENALYKQLLSCNFYIYLFHDPLNFVWIKIAAELKMLQSGLGVIIFYSLRTVGNIAISICFYYVINFLIKSFFLKKLITNVKNGRYKENHSQ